MKGIFPIDKFRTLQTPFYYYDTKVLRDTLSAINQEVAKYPSYSVHYAVKANANPKVLTIIRESGMGADCVSGGEIRAAVRAGFPANKIVFAGVGKADWEINLGLGIASLFFCVVSMFLIYIGLQLLSVYVFGLALILLIASLGVSFREIQISTRSLEIYLGAMEKGKIKK
jgi:hypothetical protein